MSTKRNSVIAPSATVSSPVRKVGKLAKWFSVDGDSVAMPPLDPRWVARWQKLKRETTKEIKLAWAREWPNNLQRDWTVGDILERAFAREDNEFGFLHRFTEGWTPDEIAVECGLEPKTLWSCWLLALRFTRETMELIIKAGISRRRFRDLNILLKVQGKIGALALELQEVLPRTRDNDARAVFYHWVDRKLLNHQEKGLGWRAEFQCWSIHSWLGRRFVRKATNFPVSKCW